MDKQKQIEEMYDDISEQLIGVLACEKMSLAIHLRSAGYRKIPENAVVLTREELDKNLEPFRLEVIALSQELVETSQKLMKARKETAEKFAEIFQTKLNELIPFASCTLAQWKQLGPVDILEVMTETCKEITEGEV